MSGIERFALACLAGLALFFIITALATRNWLLLAAAAPLVLNGVIIVFYVRDQKRKKK